MSITKLVCLLALLPAGLVGQQDAVGRLRAVLPADVADRVIAIVQEATSRGLPSEAIADRALEAQARGKGEGEIAAAARGLGSDLASSRDLLKMAGRSPEDAEVEAGAAARSMGVDSKAISTLAASAPSGQSLAVPLAVLGSLVNRGLSSDDALAAVRERLAAHASDAELAELPGEAGRLIAAGHRPADVGRALGAAQSASGGAGAAGSSGAHGGGPPASVPSNNGTAAGRSHGHSTTQHS